MTTKTSARIPVAGPWVTEREIRYVAEAAANDWYGQRRRVAAPLRAAFAEQVGVKHAHWPAALHGGTASGAAGARRRAGRRGHRSGRRPGWRPPRRSSTWARRRSSPTSIPITWCVTAESIERCITPRTKAIIVVDLYGAIPDMDGDREPWPPARDPHRRGCRAVDRRRYRRAPGRQLRRHRHLQLPWHRRR